MKRVLIVDDALDLGRLFQTTLALMDPSLFVVAVPSGEEALLEASRGPLDLLVADIRLPGMSGVELVHKIRSRNPGVKVILISGIADKSLNRLIDQAKPDIFLGKPIEMPVFMDAVRSCLGTTQEAGEGLTPSPSQRVVSGQRLSDVLANLRRSLDAQVTLLLDEDGHIIAQTGELPDASFESQWTGLIMSAISSSAKLVRQLADPKGGGAQLISGDAMRMVLAPVGGLALVVVLKASKTNLRLALTMDEVLFAQKELSYILGEIPPEAVLSALPPVTPLIAVREPVPTPSKSVESEKVLEEPEAAQSTEDFTKLFEQQDQPVNRKAANDFWETAAEAEEVESQSPDVLNYDEANRLGLTPDQES